MAGGVQRADIYRFESFAQTYNVLGVKIQFLCTRQASCR